MSCENVIAVWGILSAIGDIDTCGFYGCMQECLDAFTEVEKLEADEGYNCQACKRRGVQATKKLTLYRCPPVLVLHLKRFSANSGMFGRFSALSKVIKRQNR